jgi:hypothetical protein
MVSRLVSLLAMTVFVAVGVGEVVDVTHAGPLGTTGVS